MISSHLQLRLARPPRGGRPHAHGKSLHYHQGNPTCVHLHVVGTPAARRISRQPRGRNPTLSWEIKYRYPARRHVQITQGEGAKSATMHIHTCWGAQGDALAFARAFPHAARDLTTCMMSASLNQRAFAMIRLFLRASFFSRRMTSRRC